MHKKRLAAGVHLRPRVGLMWKEREGEGKEEEKGKGEGRVKGREGV